MINETLDDIILIEAIGSDEPVVVKSHNNPELSGLACVSHPPYCG